MNIEKFAELTINPGNLEKYKSLMKERLDLMQEQIDLRGKIGSVSLKLNDHAEGTEEGDRLRTELGSLEERNRTIHLDIQNKSEELKALETEEKHLSKTA